MNLSLDQNFNDLTTCQDHLSSLNPSTKTKAPNFIFTTVLNDLYLVHIATCLVGEGMALLIRLGAFVDSPRILFLLNATH